MTGGTGRLRPSHHPDDCVSVTKTPSPEEQPNNYTKSVTSPTNILSLRVQEVHHSA